MPQLLEIQMFHSLNNFQVMNIGEDTNAGGGQPELSADDILKALNDSGDKDDSIPDDNVEEDKSTSKEKKVDKNEEKDEEKDEELKIEEKDELTELEEDLKTPTDEELELKTPVQRRQLMKDYPDIFKKHPGLESTIYRERAYTELLPTIQDAKEALGALQTLDKFEADLLKGDTTNILKATLASDPQAFAKMADNYMENLAAVDERAYHHVLGNITKNIVVAMMKFGKESDNTEIQDAASSLYQFMFNTTKWEAPKKLSADTIVDESVSAEKQKLEKDRKEFEESKLNEHTTKLMSSIDNQVKGTIEKSIDPKDQMTPFVKSKAIEEVLTKASKLLKADGRFQQIVKQLTDKSKSEKFSEESLNRIRSAYFTKYKAILIPIIKSVRAEALKGTSARIKKDEETNDTTERANRVAADRNKDGGNNGNKNQLKPGQSYADFLTRN